jgi:hypothetical protein
MVSAKVKIVLGAIFSAIDAIVLLHDFTDILRGVFPTVEGVLLGVDVNRLLAIVGVSLFPIYLVIVGILYYSRRKSLNIEIEQVQAFLFFPKETE